MSNIKADTLSTLDGTKSITTDRVTQGVARAWVNFNGTGTVAIRASFNVSSITDNGTGDYTVNFTTAMPDADYASSGAAGISTSDLSNRFFVCVPISSASLRVGIRRSSDGAFVDVPFVYVAIFR